MGPHAGSRGPQDSRRRMHDDHLIGTYARYPITFARGEGARLWDDDGREYLDFLTGISVSSVGHCHPRVVGAIRAQAAELIHVGNLFYTEPMMRLARRLAQSSLGGKVFFTNSGAEAVEAALKLARRFKEGGDIVVSEGAFHGRTYGALSATPQETKQAPFAPLVPGFVTAANVAAAVDDRTAAVLVEPIRGETGVHPAANLEGIRDACDAHGAALIFDEIQTGLGRTGTLWAYQQTGVVPDALTTAKALGGGLPIGALVTGPKLADVLQAGDHGSTFAGGPVVCPAATAVLDVLGDAALLARSRELGERLRAGLAELPGVSVVRGRGLMNAFDLDARGAPELVRRALLGEGLVLNPTGRATVRLLPPLVVDEADADEALARLRRLL